MIKFLKNDVMNNFILDSFIEETDNQPHTGQIFLKYKFNDICLYTITTDNIKEIYVYDNFDKKMIMLLIKIGYNYKLDTYLIHYIYKFLINGKMRLY